MKKTPPHYILYQAKDIQDKNIYNYIKASSHCEAFKLLETYDYSEIKLYQSFSPDTTQPHLEGLNTKQLSIQAKLDITMFIQPSLWPYILASIRLIAVNQVRIFIGLFIFGIGLYFQYPLVMILGSIITLIVPYLIYNSYLFYDDIKHMNNAYVDGNFKEIEDIIARYKTNNQKLDDSLTLILDIQEAKLMAIRLSSGEAYETIASKYLHLKDISSYEYCMLLVDICFLDSNYKLALKTLKKVQETHPNDINILLLKAHMLLSLKEETDEINIIIQHTNPSCLEQPTSIAMYYFLQAMLIKSDNITQALVHMHTAIEFYNIKNINPAFKLQKILLEAEYALLLYKNNQKEEAKNIIEINWNILSIHGYKELHEEIFEYFPEFKNTYFIK